MDRVLKVVVVDDSAYVRKVVREILSRSPFVEVVGTARDGREALDLVAQLEPDVVTCDLIMPELDGVGFVREQMQRRPVPIIIMSIANETAEAALTALDAGAIDFVQKPTALASEKIFEVSAELIEKVKTAGQIQLNRVATTPAPPAVRSSEPATKIAGSHSVDLVVIGISTGGPQALKRLIPQFPSDFPVPILMVMHMPVGYTEMYAAKLNELSQLEVKEAAEDDEIKPGRVFLAPAGRHLSVMRNSKGKVVTHIDARPFNTLHKPAVDVLFQSAAEVYGNRVLGVVMTGMGSDGKQGAAWIKSQGGLVFTEAESSCVVYGMPSSVVEAGLSDKSVALEDMARAIREVV
ncbi:MAG TPA: chemotaxis response regulator protein-glutamate methylesterase [Pyrinomonadaceae bacterium]|jgi:two-component system, chemotaxis family, protein-glutamate methylesterase/glutaminase|nr:chemotaxis response regulator protein-glutamate methylesterase [Pyrinomonadaceae bacterium]